MSPSEFARLAEVEQVLVGAGYTVGRTELGGIPALIGESLYALVACVEFEDWDDLEERIFDVQSALTRVAGEAPSARNWDLYVVALVLVETQDAAHRGRAETIEGDTRYARKFVRVRVRQEDLARALRPLLPLDVPIDVETKDPLGELRAELSELHVDDRDADAAVDSFRRERVVIVS
jgi:hypothetical protein